MAPYVRRALHASSWYSDRAQELDAQLAGWLQQARAGEPADDAALRGKRCAAVIAPHAGYSYSGPTAAWAYKHVDAATVQRVFILGPSHHVYLDDCALSGASEYATPIGALRIDADANAAVRARAAALKLSLGRMSRDVDEEEHSIEMHLPYVAHLLQGRTAEVGIVPLLVGNLSTDAETAYGALLAPFLADPANLFVVSSDFCHWGRRFRFTRYAAEDGPIHASIEKMDRRGMQLIEAQDADGFAAYLQETHNTICGRHPIAVALHALRHAQTEHGLAGATVRFTQYAQSSPCVSQDDSSVSYASAVMAVDQQ